MDTMENFHCKPDSEVNNTSSQANKQNSTDTCYYVSVNGCGMRASFPVRTHEDFLLLETFVSRINKHIKPK